MATRDRKPTIDEAVEWSVRQICARYPVDPDDMRQEAAATVVYALRRVDPSKGDPVHYVSRAVRRQLYMAARRQCSQVSLPRGNEFQVPHTRDGGKVPTTALDAAPVWNVRAPDTPEEALHKKRLRERVRWAVRKAAAEYGVPQVGEYMLQTGGPVPVSAMALASGKSRGWWQSRATKVRKRVRELLEADMMPA